jgi:hypothetical protein
MTYAVVALRGPEKKREDLSEMTATTAWIAVGFLYMFKA